MRLTRECTTTGPNGVGSSRSAVRSVIRSSSANARSNSRVAEPLRMAEHPELGDIAAEEQRDRPIRDHAQLSREQWELVEVVRPRDPPAEEAAELEAHHVGDPLVAAERRDLAEHPVAVGLRVAAQVLRQPAGLP